MDFNLRDLFKRKKVKEEKTNSNIVLTGSIDAKNIYETIFDIKNKIEIKLNQLELSNLLGNEINNLNKKYQTLVQKGDLCIEEEQKRDGKEVKLTLYNSTTYKMELTNFFYSLDNIEKKVVFLEKINGYKYNVNNLNASINKILALRGEYLLIKGEFEYIKQNEINKKLATFYYEIIKEEIKIKGNSKLFFKLDSDDKRIVNLIFLEELKENIRLGKINDDGLIKKASDNVFEISDIKEFLRQLRKSNKVFNTVDETFQEIKKVEIIKPNFDINRKFVSDKPITTEEFYRLTGVNPLPTNKQDNLLLREYDISCIVYDNCTFEYINLSYTNAKLDPQKVAFKYLNHCDLEGVDLSQADFTGVMMWGTNLKNTNANLDPRRIHNKKLDSCNLEGVDLSQVNFAGISLYNTNLKDTGAKIDPQLLYNQDLKGCNLEGVDLSQADFTDVSVQGANLKGTKAVINPQKLKNKLLLSCNLEGLDLSQADFNDVYINDTNLKNTNARIDPQKVRYRSLVKCNLEGLDLSQADFTDVSVEGTNFKNTNARINPQKLWKKSLIYCDLEGLDLSQVDFTGVNIEGANLHSTGANIEGAIGTPKVSPSKREDVPIKVFDREKLGLNVKLIGDSPYDNYQMIYNYNNVISIDKNVKL